MGKGIEPSIGFVRGASSLEALEEEKVLVRSITPLLSRDP